MSSSIFFRFKSQKEPLQITFDGTSLSVFEVKRDIITLSRLGDGTDFDLEIYAADSNDKYDDDTTQIPRSSTVIARRLPAARPGAGKAARYVTGKMPVNARNAHRIESTNTASSKNSTPMNSAMNSGKEMTEEEKLQSILNANDQSWKAEQEAMSHKPVIRNYNKQAPVPDKPLPPGYICHRCGEKGHWIQACPTNNDPNFDGRPKFRRTTGIPRSFLKVVEKPTEVGEDGKIDVSKLPQGVMYTANGEWVVAEPDKATWDKIQEKQSAAAEKAKEAESGNQDLRDRGLECPIHKGMFVEPTKTPCCAKTYCRDCVENALLDSDLSCPNCGQQVLLDKLEPDDEMVTKRKAYDEEKKAERKPKDKEVSKSPGAAGTPKDATADAESPSAAPVPEVKINGVNSAASTPNSKKRPAEDELPNDRKPSNPAVENTKHAISNKGTPTSNNAAPVQPPIAPAADMAEFQKQMNAMASSMAGMQNGMPAMMNPMMQQGFNPAMMGMGMGMNPAMMGMPGMGMNMGAGNFGGGGWNGGGGGNQYGNGSNWQGGGRGGMQNGGFGRGGMQNGGGGGGGNDSPYMRQPMNPHRHRGRYNRPRSQDYRQV
ncbi:Protein mpe1 [Vermiconidia calcicola]|uniref:Protein mpe1 n=1 Tax=Vermiconidia calcicola TaxID=1690605 RepID=A0ACC3NJ66_9PEZI|nr:Protein mpe1 [Vermiconidia calcicola]